MMTLKVQHNFHILFSSRGIFTKKKRRGKRRKEGEENTKCYMLPSAPSPHYLLHATTSHSSVVIQSMFCNFITRKLYYKKYLQFLAVRENTLNLKCKLHHRCECSVFIYCTITINVQHHHVLTKH